MLDIRHTGICCDDLEKANLFYQKLLGLTYVASDRESGDFIKSLLGLDSLTWIKLATKSGQLLELYWLPNRNNNSFNHIAFTVENLIRIRNKLVEYEIKCSEIKTSKSNKHKVMFCRDYDNNLIELVENI
jgi:catechol 2,3-dioxygenase-like lactoylglutathione lyase family enzyme